MKKTLILILPIISLLSAYAGDGTVFPFDQNPSIAFLRQGDNNYQAGAWFSMKLVNGQWEIEVKNTKTNKKIKTVKLTDEKSKEILQAFSSLYNHWNTKPETSSNLKRYSIWLSLNHSDWSTQISVRDAGSAELKKLLTLIEYTD